MASRSRRRAREDGPEDLGDHSAAISALRAELDRLVQEGPPKVPVFSGVMGGLAAVVEAPDGNWQPSPVMEEGASLTLFPKHDVHVVGLLAYADKSILFMPLQVDVHESCCRFSGFAFKAPTADADPRVQLEFCLCFDRRHRGYVVGTLSRLSGWGVDSDQGDHTLLTCSWPSAV